MFLFTCIALLLALGFIKLVKNKKLRKVPPGPRSWPLVGNFPQIARESKNVMKAFFDFAKTYGEIYPLKVGFTSTVVLSSQEAIRTVLAHDDADGGENTRMFKDRLLGMNIVKNFQLVFQDIFIGGTESTSTQIESLIKYLTLFPEIQEKLYLEIASIIQNGEQVCLADRNKSIAALQSLLIFHLGGQQDFFYKEFLIGKDALIIGHVLPMYDDPEVWGDPENFRPERFINDKGELHKTDQVMPFGYGERVCPGETSATSLGLILLTSILQKYSVCIPSGDSKLTREPVLGFFFNPKPFNVCFKLRTQIHQDVTR